jgi:hypothetical protein
VQEFQNRGFTVHCLDFSSEAQIPTFICILEKLGGWYCGGSTGINFLKASERSVDEALSTFLWNMQTSLGGGNLITEDLVLNLEPDFTDKNATDVTKNLIFGNSTFVSNFDKFIMKGEESKYTEEFNKQEDFDVYKFANQKFGDTVYLYKQEKSYLEEYNYFVTKVYIPNSYYFALNETKSRPVLNNLLPTFTKINPFP